ncbi:hypothetical protein EYZ11_002602 [Aspergillus tanneri]|uniref:Major facilitator superfamily (MFS) profile domain-containing protein n=1 Tax=Aspergillus tanneri TaxID=1220188 RepID=A0A4V3UQ73_9EURO|nr:hypothetical protein EYZ11_002602 [Aspergillus tanneri]
MTAVEKHSGPSQSEIDAPLSATGDLQPEKQVNINTGNGDTLAGWRLTLLTIGVFLSALDITIVSTSLTAIANDLQAFEKSSWVVSSYLTSYFSFLIIWAKLSDFFGRKLMLVAALVLFLVFSGGCAGAKSTIQLIMFRAFQGVGGAGIFSMAPIIVAEMVTPEKYGAYNGIISLAIAFSFLLGPLFGGAITDGTSWRWIFYINLPVGFVALGLVLLAMPVSFPDVSQTQSFSLIHKKIDWKGQVDYPGFFLLLAACVLLIVAIEEAGISFSWSSALVITCLVLAAVLLCMFFAWQWLLYRRKSTREPVFPWTFMKNRVLMGMYLNAILSGVPFVTLVLEMPLRFENVNNSSAVLSGVRILPYTMTIALGSALTGGLTARGRVPPIFVLCTATILQLLGVGLLYSIPVDTNLPAKLYGYQVLAGLGVGLSLTTLLNIVPFIVDKSVLSVAMGGVTQLRILGGALGVSIATNLLNNTAKSQLRTQLPTDVISKILANASYVNTLPRSDQELVREAFADGFHKQLLMILAFCAAEVLALVLIWERPARRLA